MTTELEVTLTGVDLADIHRLLWDGARRISGPVITGQGRSAAEVRGARARIDLAGRLQRACPTLDATQVAVLSLAGARPGRGLGRPDILLMARMVLRAGDQLEEFTMAHGNLMVADAARRAAAKRRDLAETLLSFLAAAPAMQAASLRPAAARLQAA